MLKYRICKKLKYHTSVEVLEKEDQDIERAELQTWRFSYTLKIIFISILILNLTHK